MVLSKKHILENIKKGSLKFIPSLDGFQLQPHAVDLRLGFDFYLPKAWKLTKKGREAITIDPLEYILREDMFENIKLKPGQFFELLPEEYIIASTYEKIEMNSNELMGVLYPRSSINRRGLAVDLSGIIDIGYKGTLMIPIVNNTRDQIIRVYPGERICQIIFQKISSKITKKEALVHGLNTAKYHNNKKGFINGRLDKSVEIDYINKGRISDLKRKYRLS